MPSTATITAFYSFVALTKIQSAQVNNNFSIFRGHIIPVDPNTATAGASGTYDLGESTHYWRGNYLQYGYFSHFSTVTANPAAGFLSIYAKDDNNIYKRTPAGVETQIASSPLTTRGDLFSFNTTTSDRVPIGSSGQVLTVDSATNTSIKWATPGVGTPTIVTTSGGMTVTISHDYCIFTGSSASTFTMYAATTGTKPVGIKNKSSTVDLTVQMAGSDTADDETSWVLPPNQTLKLVPDGTTEFNVF